MGLSNSKWDSANKDPVDELLKVMRGSALDAKKISSVSYEQFAAYIKRLNEITKQLVDSKGKYLLFAIKKDSANSLLWKATVTICCLKVSAETGRIEASRCMDLLTFLNVHEMIISMMSVDGAADCAAVGPCQPDMNASIILEKLDAFGSSDIGGECCICMERKPEVLLPCAHCFCLPCIEQWNVSNPVCPTCRARSDTNEAWVISDYPDQTEVRDYIMKLTKD